MKTAFFARASAVLLAVPMLILVQAPNGSAAVEGMAIGEPSSASSCTDKAKFIPTSIFTEFKFGLAEAFSGYELRLSNKKGDCSATLYASKTAEK